MRTGAHGQAGGRLAGLLGLLLLVPVLAGCGGRGTVSGKVLYKGKGVPEALVTFHPDNPQVNAVSARTDEEGKYEVTLPAGEVRISVENAESEEPAESGPPPQLPAIKLPPGVKPNAGRRQPQGDTGKKRSRRGERIPQKFWSVDTSGLKYTVRSGSQTHDVELK